MNEYNNTGNNEFLSWDETPITVEDLAAAPEGLYDFRILNYERTYTEPQDGRQTTPKAVVNLELTNSAGEVYSHRVHLLLTLKAAWRIKSLFVAVGLADPKEKTFVPYWNKLNGTTGKIELSKNTKPAANGNFYMNEKFLAPSDPVAVNGFAQQNTGFTSSQNGGGWRPQGGGF